MLTLRAKVGDTKTISFDCLHSKGMKSIPSTGDTNFEIDVMGLVEVKPADLYTYAVKCLEKGTVQFSIVYNGKDGKKFKDTLTLVIEDDVAAVSGITLREV